MRTSSTVQQARKAADHDGAWRTPLGRGRKCVLCHNVDLEHTVFAGTRMLPCHGMPWCIGSRGVPAFPRRLQLLAAAASVRIGYGQGVGLSRGGAKTRGWPDGGNGCDRDSLLCMNPFRFHSLAGRSGSRVYSCICCIIVNSTELLQLYRRARCKAL